MTRKIIKQLIDLNNLSCYNIIIVGDSMKKILRILFVVIISIIFIPNVYATNNLEIESINLVDNSEDVIEFSSPKINNNTGISFDLSFLNLNSFAKYKGIINNKTDKDYYIDNESKFNNSDYVSYKYELEDGVKK